MGQFWESWELWEKMTFVLGVAIFVTVLLGLGRLAHKHHQLRVFTRAARRRHELEAQRLAHPEMAETADAAAGSPTAASPTAAGKGGQRIGVRRGRARTRANDVPFGVRAIESGVEVEGVWISRGNSPARPSPGASSGDGDDDDGSRSGSREHSPAAAAKTGSIGSSSTGSMATGSGGAVSSKGGHGKGASVGSAPTGERNGRNSRSLSLHLPEPAPPALAAGPRGDRRSQSPEGPHGQGLNESHRRSRPFSSSYVPQAAASGESLPAPQVRQPSPGPAQGLESGPRAPRPSYKPRQSSGLRFSTGDLLEDGGAGQSGWERKRRSDCVGHHGHHSSLPSGAHHGSSSSDSSHASSEAAPLSAPRHSQAPHAASARRPTSFTNFSLPGSQPPSGAHHAPAHSHAGDAPAHAPAFVSPAAPAARSRIDLLPFTRDSRGPSPPPSGGLVASYAPPIGFVRSVSSSAVALADEAVAGPQDTHGGAPRTDDPFRTPPTAGPSGRGSYAQLPAMESGAGLGWDERGTAWGASR